MVLTQNPFEDEVLLMNYLFMSDRRYMLDEVVTHLPLTDIKWLNEHGFKIGQTVTIKKYSRYAAPSKRGARAK